ncbi:MAG: RNA polymerase sigma factor [Bacteroidales bacterium]|nr:RNA polymerase sigma factor [Bacteroidales bacterium]
MEKEFIELINRHQGILQKICNIYFYRNPYKEDSYQEMLIRLWKSYPDFKNQSAFSTWLYRVALNTAIDIIRKQSLRPLHAELSNIEYNIPDKDQNTESDKKDKLYQAINCLSDIEKAIIILHLEDYNYKEIAEIIGISESNTGVKINRIKCQLLKILGDGQN